MRNKKLIKTAVCGAILSASLMVSQQNIYAAQEENIINAETGEKEASQNVPEPGAEQDIIKDEEQPPDPNPDSDAAEDPDEKKEDADSPSDEPTPEVPTDENNQAVPVKTGWIEEEDGTHYYREDGTLATGWLTLEEGTYYLDEQGLKTTGWQTIEKRNITFRKMA